MNIKAFLNLRLFLFFLNFIAFNLISLSSAQAVSVSIDAAVDNTLHRVWVVENGVTTQTLDLEYSGWKHTTTFDIDFDPTKHVELYFWAENSDTRTFLSADQNPGGLLAQFSSTDSNFDGILTSNQWEVSLDMTNWEAATEWGANNDTSTIWWRNNNFNPIAGMNLASNWIWYSNNFTNTQPGIGEAVYFRFELTPAVIPEPTTLTLLGTGLFGLIARRKTKN